MSREERLIYHDVPQNLTPEVKPYVDRVLAAEGVVIIHPVWNYGYPAILKGFFDRIFIPGVSFVLENGDLRTVMRKKRVAYITSYGGDRFRTWLMGDPPRRLGRRRTGRQDDLADVAGRRPCRRGTGGRAGACSH